MPIHARHPDGDIGNQRISAIYRITTERHFDGYRCLPDVDPLAQSQKTQRAVKACGVTGGEKLFGIGAAARAAEFDGQAQIEDETAIVGFRDA
ncbi:hypothetical protein BSLA_03r1641 [Burkholderia stabilis]|nr:hypothetical protein BSLA_03r1641 [Burkholderia stabilis]